MGKSDSSSAALYTTTYLTDSSAPLARNSLSCYVVLHRWLMLIMFSLPRLEGLRKLMPLIDTQRDEVTNVDRSSACVEASRGRLLGQPRPRPRHKQWVFTRPTLKRPRKDAHTLSLFLWKPKPGPGHAPEASKPPKGANYLVAATYMPFTPFGVCVMSRDLISEAFEGGADYAGPGKGDNGGRNGAQRSEKEARRTSEGLGLEEGRSQTGYIYPEGAEGRAATAPSHTHTHTHRPPYV